MKNYIWVEKYRPKSVQNIVQQDDIKQLLQQAISTKNLTHMLFFGPPGTGKTSTALALAKQLYHLPKLESEDLWTHLNKNNKLFSERVMELNASDERGIKVVREKIKNFASASINSNYDIPPFKIIILDEADAMTTDSQFALRRIIEKYTFITRFILVCNYVTKIISPLASRCAKFRFQSITPVCINKIINNIIIKEKITIDANVIVTLYDITKGDLRKAINLLQRSSYINKDITSDIILDVSGQINNEYIKNMWNILKDKKTTCIDILNLNKQFKNDAYSSIALLNEIFKLVINSNEISDTNKSSLILNMCKIDYYLNDNSNEYQYIQINDLK